jgi:hypothetical protein
MRGRRVGALALGHTFKTSRASRQLKPQAGPGPKQRPLAPFHPVCPKNSESCELTKYVGTLQLKVDGQTGAIPVYVESGC